jgi:hypothetical protein
LDRASGYEPEGREFESLRAHHITKNSLQPTHLSSIILCVNLSYLKTPSRRVKNRDRSPFRSAGTSDL